MLFAFLLLGSSCDKKIVNSNSSPTREKMINSHPSPPRSFQEILDSLDDFLLSDFVSGAVEDKYGYEEIIMFSDHVPFEHRVAGYVWAMTGGLQNGGYSGIFTLECDPDAYPKCLRVLGLHELSDTVEKSLELVPLDARGNEGILIEYFGTWDQFKSEIEGVENTFFDGCQSIQAAHSKYIRDNAAAFEVLAPEIEVKIRNMNSLDRSR
jgi:hypothetical protein